MNKKLDPELRARLRSLRKRADVTELSPSEEAREARVEVIVEFTGAIADLTAVGFESRTVIEHAQQGYRIATGAIPIARLEDLAAIEHVVEIEGPQQFHPMLNYSVPEVRANAVHTGTPSRKGDGVVIGVIDSGIDWRHRAFVRPDGSSKILAIWDQMLPAIAGETPGPGGVGVVYTQFTDPSTVRTRDKNARNETNGHGTHVAGIVAGNGRPASCCHGENTYVGVAPNASLVVVRYDYTHDRFEANIRVVEALDFIFNTSPAQGKPTVVNISLGFNHGPHDGTTGVERAIDALIAGHPGRAIVVAAGNFANTQCHVKGSVPGNGAVDVEFKVREGHEYAGLLDLWYDRAGTLSLNVTAVGGTSSGVVAHGADLTFVANPTAAANRQSTVDIDGTINGAHGRDNNFRIVIRKPTSGNIPHGDWKLTLTNPNAAAVNFHCWIDRGDDVHQPIFLPAVNPPDGKIRSSSDSTLSTPSTAVEAITVANHEARTDWCDCWPSTGIVSSSSRGPVARGAAMNPKPDIAAPGLLITAPKADAANLRGNCCACCPDACCCLYEDMTGTSMAAPHVAGAIALMLEKNPTLTKAQILTHLQATARAAPAGGPRETWGAGKLDAQAAVNAVPAPPGGGGGGGGTIQGQNEIDGEVWTHKLGPQPEFIPDHQHHASIRSTSDLTSLGGAQLPAPLQILKARMERIPNGRLAAAVVSRNFSEVRRLINTNRRVAALWHRSDGPRLLRRLLVGAIDAEAPAAILSEQQHHYIERWFDMLSKYGSRRLKENVERYRHLIIGLLLELLASQVATHVEGPS